MARVAVRPDACTGANNGAGFDLHAEVKIRDFNQVKRKLFRYHSGFVSGSPSYFEEIGAGTYTNAVVLDAFNVFPGSGTFTLGQVVVRGRRG
jgi:hypothetical protein